MEILVQPELRGRAGRAVELRHDEAGRQRGLGLLEQQPPGPLPRESRELGHSMAREDLRAVGMEVVEGGES